MGQIGGESGLGSCTESAGEACSPTEGREIQARMFNLCPESIFVCMPAKCALRFPRLTNGTERFPLMIAPTPLSDDTFCDWSCEATAPDLSDTFKRLSDDSIRKFLE